MSRVKSAAEKKRLSLERDRRNIHGECPTSSRKNIRRGKQRGHMEVRRAANEELRALKGTLEQSVIETSEADTRDRVLLLSRQSFKKWPDAPLGEVLKRKQKKRERRARGTSQ
jgi:hypothetical protein